MCFKHQFYANFTPATRMLPKEMDMGFFPKLFLGVMLKVRSLLGSMLPGDFPLCHYEGEWLPTLMATGMKYHSIQKWMYEHAPAHFGTDAIIEWIEKAFHEAPRSTASVACQGQVLHHTGPTAFMKQARIYEKAGGKLQKRTDPAINSTAYEATNNTSKHERQGEHASCMDSASSS